jgi:hypothetical protein
LACFLGFHQRVKYKKKKCGAHAVDINDVRCSNAPPHVGAATPGRRRTCVAHRERWVESRQVPESASFDTSEVKCVGAAMQEPRVCEGVLCAWLAPTCAHGASTSTQYEPTDTPTPLPPRQQGRHHPLPLWRQLGWQDPPPQPRVTHTHARWA